MMQASRNAIDLIRRFEGFRPKAYQCPAGVWTIGYGTTRGVTMGMTVTEETAMHLLEEEVEDIVKRISVIVRVPLNQNQLDALVSFIYNIGFPAFLTSTLLYQLNKGNYQMASYQISRWNKVNGKVFRGLENRRKEERELFTKED